MKKYMEKHPDVLYNSCVPFLRALFQYDMILETFIALGNAKTSLFLAVLRKIILLIPLIFILPNFFADKAFAVFLAEPVSDFIAAAVTTFMFFRFFLKMLKEVAKDSLNGGIGWIHPHYDEQGEFAVKRFKPYVSVKLCFFNKFCKAYADASATGT